MFLWGVFQLQEEAGLAFPQKIIVTNNNTSLTFRPPTSKMSFLAKTGQGAKEYFAEKVSFHRTLEK